MQVETSQIGGALRLGDPSRIVIHNSGVEPLGPRSALVVSLPAPVTPARSLLQVVDDGGRLLFRRPCLARIDCLAG